MAGWRDTVEQVLELEPEHLSCYGLKGGAGHSPGRPGGAGEKLPDDDQQADMYLWTVERLAAAATASMRSLTLPGRASSPGTT